MAKVVIVKGKSFRPAFAYLVQENKQARILGGNVSSPAVEDAIEHNLVFNSQNNRGVIDELSSIFNAQSQLNSRVKLVCRHCIIAFDPLDGSPSDSIKLQAASGFMERMGYSNSSWVAFDHQRDDHHHRHIHLIGHAVDLDGKRISDSLDFGCARSAMAEIEDELGLTPLISNIEKLVAQQELWLNFNSQQSFDLLAFNDEIEIPTLLEAAASSSDAYRVEKQIARPTPYNLPIKLDGYIPETDLEACASSDEPASALLLGDRVVTFFDDAPIQVTQKVQPFVTATSESLEPIPAYYNFPPSVEIEDDLDFD
jgi:Relaxase/Mobilisation nuclease domain